MRRNCVLKLFLLFFFLFNSLSWKKLWTFFGKCKHHRWFTLSAVSFRVLKQLFSNLTWQTESAKFWNDQSARRVPSTYASTSSCINVAPKTMLWLCRGIYTSTWGLSMIVAPTPYFKCYSPSAEQPAHWFSHQATSLLDAIQWFRFRAF